MTTTYSGKKGTATSFQDKLEHYQRDNIQRVLSGRIFKEQDGAPRFSKEADVHLLPKSIAMRSSRLNLFSAFHYHFPKIKWSPPFQTGGWRPPLGLSQAMERSILWNVDVGQATCST